ncbi:hypothetical protein PR048_017494 [Dryococelus australis]|uniref:Uncharacterized protein n=1 Tax=Dryococelus australis TaxID=614101 RepID=A0ABQ9H9V2_9NEOP|nr:hypothetical protein PR048_017494 [Dryococelus australis]
MTPLRLTTIRRTHQSPVHDRFGAAMSKGIPRFRYRRIFWIASHYGRTFKDAYTSKKSCPAIGSRSRDRWTDGRLTDATDGCQFSFCRPPERYSLLADVDFKRARFNVISLNLAARTSSQKLLQRREQTTCLSTGLNPHFREWETRRTLSLARESYRGAPECKGGGNGRSLRKPRRPVASSGSIRKRSRRESNPVRLGGAISLTTTPPRHSNAQKSKTRRASRECPLPLQEGVVGLFISLVAANESCSTFAYYLSEKLIASTSCLKQKSFSATGTMVAERLDCSPSTEANQAQSSAGSLPDFHKRCRWSAIFLGHLPFPPPLHSGAAAFSPHLTLIGSEDLVHARRPPRRTGFNTRPGHQIFASGKIAIDRRLFSVISRFPASSFRRRSIFTLIALINSQDLAASTLRRTPVRRAKQGAPGRSKRRDSRRVACPHPSLPLVPCALYFVLYLRLSRTPLHARGNFFFSPKNAKEVTEPGWEINSQRIINSSRKSQNRQRMPSRCGRFTFADWHRTAHTVVLQVCGALDPYVSMCSEPPTEVADTDGETLPRWRGYTRLDTDTMKAVHDYTDGRSEITYVAVLTRDASELPGAVDGVWGSDLQQMTTSSGRASGCSNDDVLFVFLALSTGRRSLPPSAMLFHRASQEQF